MYISVKNLKKSFDEGRIMALRGVDLEIEQGEFIAIMGPSGCGKSTLLNIIGALDRPDEGEIVIDGKNLGEEKELASFRAHMIGYVFQLHNLIPSLTALENVMGAPVWVKRQPKDQVRSRALTQLDVGERAMPEGGCAQSSLVRVLAAALRGEAEGRGGVRGDVRVSAGHAPVRVQFPGT
jgi:putative ABC transport system ATP-binding protein